MWWVLLFDEDGGFLWWMNVDDGVCEKVKRDRSVCEIENIFCVLFPTAAARSLYPFQKNSSSHNKKNDGCCLLMVHGPSNKKIK